MTKPLFIFLGTVSLALGILGIFIPLLPTTPFLLLASFCYYRSSKRLHHFITNNKVVGPYIKNYMEGRGVSLKHKGIALFMLWSSILYTSIAVLTHWLPRVVLFSIACAVTAHLVRLKTRRP